MTELSEFFPAFQKNFGQDRKMTEKTKLNAKHLNLRASYLRKSQSSIYDQLI